MLAIVEAYRAGLLDRKHWFSNLIAGTIVGIVALPLSMAFAIASGAKPEEGLYTAIIAGLFVGIFGGSRSQIAGPTGAFVVILAGVTARYGIEGLQLATLMAGVLLVLMGVMRLGSVIKFIPDPVIIGFTTGIGLIIFVGEIKDFFGLKVALPLDGRFDQKVMLLMQDMPNVDVTTALIGFLSLAIVILTPKFFKRLPGPLLAMVAATLMQMTFQFPGVATLGSAFGGIPSSLPTLHFPSFSYQEVLDLIGPAFTIALLGAIESLLSAAVADSMAGTRHHSNQELIGQGLANMAAPLFGGFAATGAIARTATNVRNGGTSPLSAVVHSIFLVSVILLLAPLAAQVPLCSFAAILFYMAYKMSDIPHFYSVLKQAPRYDAAVLVVTFLLTVFVNLVVAINIGVILAMLFFIRNMNLTVNVQSHSSMKSPSLTLPSDTIVYSIQGPLFFGAAEKIEHTLAATQTTPKTIIFRLNEVPFMDLTGMTRFRTLIAEYQKRGIHVMLCEANQPVINRLSQIGLLDGVDDERLYSTLEEAITSVEKPLATPAPQQA